jgi:hypothetical protein
MVDKVALGQFYLRLLWFTTVIIIRVHISAPYSPSKINLIRGAGNTSGPSKKKVGSTEKRKHFHCYYSLPFPKGKAGIAWEPSDA